MDSDDLKKAYADKTIHELRFVVCNPHIHSEVEINTAKELIKEKQTAWRARLEKVTKDLDAIIRKDLWFDFHVLSYDGYRLVVGGSTDLAYYHNLEIIFEDVFFFSGYFQKWTTDTKEPTFLIPENEFELNHLFQIEEDYQIFTFKAEDCSDIIVVAKNISYNTDAVLYYYRENLNHGERLADFVKKENNS